MRRMVSNESVAVKIRETFTDRPATKRTAVHWQWPEELHEIGICEAVMYTSDKWKRKGSFEDYKHVAEGKQWLHVQPGLLVEYDNPKKKLPVVGPYTELTGPMPLEFAELAPILGVQVQLYKASGRDFVPSGEYRQVDLARAKLGGAEHPKTRERFLIIYTPSELLAVITGEELDILADGIVG